MPGVGLSVRIVFFFFFFFEQAAPAALSACLVGRVFKLQRAHRPSGRRRCWSLNETRRQGTGSQPAAGGLGVAKAARSASTRSGRR
eukprot:3817058-Prymnesium_polylepis.1